MVPYLDQVRGFKTLYHIKADRLTESVPCVSSIKLDMFVYQKKNKNEKIRHVDRGLRMFKYWVGSWDRVELVQAQPMELLGSIFKLSSAHGCEVLAHMKPICKVKCLFVLNL